MKGTKKALSFILAAILACALCFTAACGDKPDPNPGPDPGPDPDVQTVGITVSAANGKTDIRPGETVKLTVTITNADDKTYEWSVSDDTILAVNNDVVSVLPDAVFTGSVTVNVTATANADKTKSASVTFTVRPAIAGQSGDLTAAMLEAVSGANLTVKGTVTDKYVDSQNTRNNVTRIYDTEVRMDEGKWYGSWSERPMQSSGLLKPVVSTVTTNYRRGEQVGVSGHELLEIGLDRHNQVKTTAMRTWDGTYVTWESQHLYNHLGDLNGGQITTDKFIQLNEEGMEGVYEYVITPSGEYDTDASVDEYLMAYLAVSLTPILEAGENFTQFYLKVENGSIVGIMGQTNVEIAYDDDNQTVLASAWTEVELSLSDIGATEIPDPAPYQADANTPLLASAIEEMAAAKNYEFQAIDTSVQAPSYDEGDYEIESLSTVAYRGEVSHTSIVPLADDPKYSVDGPFNKGTAASGTVGRIGFVTEDVILFQDTGMYSASMDGQDYYYDYSGYKQYFKQDGSPDYFETFATSTYDASVEEVKSLVATRRQSGDMFSQLPAFDFAPELFQYDGKSPLVVGGAGQGTYNMYTLRDSSITAEIAEQISPSDDSDSGAPSAFQKVTIYVDDDGHVVATIFPYDILYGTYLGYVTTVYGELGAVKLNPADFSGENYIEREWKGNWSQYATQDYYENHQGPENDHADTVVVLKAMFGDENYSKLPQPELFMNLVGDSISGPWFDYTTYYQDEDETIVDHYVDKFHFNMTMADEDIEGDFGPKDITQVLGPNGKLTRALANIGYTYSAANSGFYSEGSDLFYGCYVNESAGVQVVIENIGTKYLYVYFYHMGDWSMRSGTNS